MSHIVSFKVNGLAGRKEPLELELNRDTNIFFGLNGSGKTSLLKILHAAMANETDLLVTVPFESAEVKIYSINYKKVFTRTIEKKSSVRRSVSNFRSLAHREVRLEGELMIVDEPRSDNWRWDCSPKTPSGAISSRWRHQYLPTSRLHLSDEPIASTLGFERIGPSWLTEDKLDVLFARSVERLWGSYSAHVLGDVRKAQEQGLANILRAVLSPESTSGRRGRSKLTPTAAFERVQSFLNRQGSTSILGKRANFERRYVENATLQDVVHDIDQVEDKIKEAMTARDTLEELITKMFLANKEIRFTDQAIEVSTPSGEKIGLASLSSGEKHLLRILVQLLLVEENSMMIDEPEISMHIDWQKVLINSMRSLNPDAQLIFATHSPEIMADIPDDKIFRI